MTDPTAHPPTPPAAERRPRKTIVHGREPRRRIRLAARRELAGDPRRPVEDPARDQGLSRKRECYAEAVLSPTEELQGNRRRIARSHQGGRFAGPLARDGPFEYFVRFREGGQHELICRRARGGGDDAILLDGATRRRRQVLSNWAPPNIRPITGCWPGVRTTRVPNSTRSASAISKPAANCRTSSDALKARSSGRRTPRRFITSASTTTTGPADHRHRLGTQERTTNSSRRIDPAWFVNLRRSRSGRLASSR